MENTVSDTARSTNYRWVQLVIGVICMAMIANLQYGWTFFVNPMSEKHGWERAAIQVAFSIFIITETWLVPIEGWFVDRYGPRIVVLIGGLMCGVAWVMNAYADSLALLYVAAAIGGIGAGAVYGTCVGNSLKWFPDRRGLAAGIVAGGFGGGSALTVIPIANTIAEYGYQNAFLWFGLGQGVIVIAAALLLRAPQAGETPVVPATSAVKQTARDFKPGEVLRGLEPTLADPSAGIRGLHLYTFNEVGRTERWRRETLARVAAQR